MTQSKAAASLAPSLLARKGGARPAMRPQFQRLPVAAADGEKAFQDLGWNDMGLTSYPTTGRASGSLPAMQTPRQGTATMEDSQSSDKATDATSQQRRQRSVTVRMDLDRHLQLRLASILENQSAQELIRHALDELLAG